MVHGDTAAAASAFQAEGLTNLLLINKLWVHRCVTLQLEQFVL